MIKSVEEEGVRERGKGQGEEEEEGGVGEEEKEHEVCRTTNRHTKSHVSRWAQAPVEIEIQE